MVLPKQRVGCLKMGANSRILVLLASMMVILLLWSESQLLKQASAYSTVDGDRLMEVWPQPLRFKAGKEIVGLDPAEFKFVIVQGHNMSSTIHDVLRSACERYFDLIFSRINAGPHFLDYEEKIYYLDHLLKKIRDPENTIQSLQIKVKRTDESTYRLGMDMDESYTLHIYESDRADLIAETWIGALRGLETFSQLVIQTSIVFADSEGIDEDRQDYQLEDGPNFIIANVPLFIEDKPRFQWRGVLVDTSRHFIAVEHLLRSIDAMSYNKMNVFHWHITDSQSFPLKLDTLPEFARDAAFSPNSVYTTSDVRRIVEYAKRRGIRVVPEIDMPGHVTSWKASHPEVVVDCPDSLPALDPTKEQTFKLVEKMLAEVTQLFEDDYIHLGGDEVDFDCWGDNEEIVQWMKDQNLDEGNGVRSLQDYFGTRIQQLASQFGKKTTFWQESFSNKFKLREDTAIHIWLDYETTEEVIKSQRGVIMNYGYYLDVQHPTCIHKNPECVESLQWFWRDTWKVFYLHDPVQFSVSDEKQLQYVYGGEASSWSENVDEMNLDSRIWSRTPAVAEKLWSPQRKTAGRIDNAQLRMTKFTCKLKQRGIKVGPTLPGYCPYNRIGERKEIDLLQPTQPKREIVQTVLDTSLNYNLLYIGFSLGCFVTLIAVFLYSRLGGYNAGGRAAHRKRFSAKI